MKQIEIISAMLAYMIWGKKSEGEYEEIEKEASQTNLLFSGIYDLLKQGRICEAENRLFDAAAEDDANVPEAALLFYKELGKMSDEELEAHDFSRGEILDGIKDICDMYGVEYDVIV